MLDRLATHLYRYRLIWSGLIVGMLGWSVWYGAAVFQHLDSGSLLDDKEPSAQVLSLINERFPAAQPALVAVVQSEKNLISDAEFRSELADFARRVDELNPRAKVIDSFDRSANVALVSIDGHATYVPIQLTGSDREQTATYRLIKQAAEDTTGDESALTIKIGGQTAISDELISQIESDMHWAELISLVLLIPLLLFVFRSVAAAVAPLLTGGASIFIALALVRLYTSIGSISVFAINIISFLGLGLAIDYSLLIISRYREERRRHPDTETALRRTLASAGRTVCFSGTIVLVSLLGLCLFPAPFMQSVGVGGALAVAVTVLISLVVLPVLLAWLGPKIEWGKIGRVKTTESQVWVKLSHYVIRRAGPILIIVLGALIALGIPFLRVNLSLTDENSLPVSFTSRQAVEELHRLFPATNTPTIQIVTESTTVDAARVDQYADLVRAVNGVRYVSIIPNERYSLLTVITTNRDQGEIVRDIRTIASPDGLEPLVGGKAAQLIDLLSEIKAGLLPAALVIILTTFIVLLFMLGSILVPLKAVLLNALSLSASLGLLTLIFQDGHLSRWLDFQSNGSIEAALPMIIFAIAFGLSMDYEVFMVSRIKEKVDQGGDTTEAVAYGLQKTGSIINSAAILLLVVIGSFATGQVLSIKEISVGLVIAVLIDVLLVRTLLVPATMYFLGEYNWWLPAWLRRLVERAGLTH